MFRTLAVCLASVVGGGALAAATQVPDFDVGPSCRASATWTATRRDDNAICLREEKRARATLIQGWRQFALADRRRCTQLSSLGGSPTYTELLTCLEVSRDVRTLRNRQAPVTTGAGRTSGQAH